MLSKEQIAKVSVLEMLRKYKVEHSQAGDFVKVRCNHPAHVDDNPSCAIGLNSKIFKCFACGVTGNLIEYLRRHTSREYSAIEKEICQHYGLRSKIAKSTPALAEHLCQELLRLRPAKLMEALRHRCITDDLILKYQIGYDIDNASKGRLTIPFYDTDANLLFIKSYLPGDKNLKIYIENKWNNCSGKQNFEVLYPLEQLEFDTIILFGGEMKALAAIPQLNSEGIGSVSKGGERIPIHATQLPELKGKEIIVCMDSDTVGRAAQVTISQKLAKDGLLHGFKVYTMELPLSGGDDDKDVNDFLRGGGKLMPYFEAAIKNAVDIAPDKAPLDLQPTVSIDSPDMIQGIGGFYEFTAKVTRIQTDRLKHCDTLALICPDKGYCENCPYHVGQVAFPFEVQAKRTGNSKAILADSLMAVKKDEIRMIMPIACTKATLQPIREGNRLYKATINHNISAYIVDRGSVAIREGEAYRMKAESLLDADGHSALWVYALESNSFKVDASKLTQFQIALPTVETVKQKLQYIALHNVFVTGMGNQLLYHIWLDLALHSSMSFTDFDGTEQMGMVSLLTIGDTGTGKSRSYERLLEYFGLPVGEYVVNGTDITVPGLVGAINMRSKNGATINEGSISRRNGRMMIVNECHRLNQNVINKFSDLISSNKITIEKAVSVNYAAATRLLFFGNPIHANPINSWKVSAYSNRAEIIIKSFKNPEFVRRMTYCYIIGEAEIKSTCKGVEAFTREEMQHRLHAAWMRQPVLNCNPELVRNFAGKLNVAFATQFAPYFDGNYTRVKLLQVAVAIANSLCSDVVLDCHVEAAYDLLHKSYCENMDLANYALNCNNFDESGAKRALFKCENRESVIATIIRSNGGIEWREFKGLIEPFAMQNIVYSELAAIGAFNSDPLNKGYIVFNSMFVDFLKTIKFETPKYGAT